MSVNDKLNKNTIINVADVVSSIIEGLKNDYGYEANDNDVAFIQGFLTHSKMVDDVNKHNKVQEQW